MDKDIGSILQPLITKYSNLNKQYRRDFEGEEYAQKRLQLNSDLEKEIAEKLPYLESREIKKIVWPSPKATFRNTGIVLLVMLVTGLVIFGLDTGLHALFGLVMDLAGN